jgi:hypothetical protein
MTVPCAGESDERYSKEETEQRREDALKRMLSTPPKQHAKMKIGRGASAKERPASKGRVHKGRKGL